MGAVMMEGILTGVGLILMMHSTIISHTLEPFDIQNHRWWLSFVMLVVGWAMFIVNIKKAQG